MIKFSISALADILFRFRFSCSCCPTSIPGLSLSSASPLVTLGSRLLVVIIIDLVVGINTCKTCMFMIAIKKKQNSNDAVY